MQSMFLDARENNAASTQQGSAQLCEKVLCLCHRLEVSPKTCFDALLLSTKYLGPAGNSMITPNSKKRVQEPITLVSAASVLAALTTSEKRSKSESAVLQAASGLFGTFFSEKVTSEHLKKTAEEILGSKSNSEKASAGADSSPTTAQLIEDLHAQLSNQLSSQIEIKIAFLLLELLCLANHGSQCAAVLQKGGSLAAGACLAAAYCLASPPPFLPISGQNQGLEILSAISTLTGFPDEVILTQTRSLLEQALSDGKRRVNSNLNFYIIFLIV